MAELQGRQRGQSGTHGRGKILLSSTQHSDQLWGPASLRPNGYHGLFPQR